MLTNCISNTVNGIKTIKTIFHWQSGQQRSSHCLLCIYIDEVHRRAVVIASELDSNRQNTAITHDIKGLASAVAQELGPSIGVPMEQVTWIVHYGDFSQPRSYENLGFPDEFSRVDLPLDGTDLGAGVGEWTVLRTTQIQEILGWTNLEPVEQVVAELRSR